MRGRPRKPTGLHLINGTYRADRHGDPAEEPQPRKRSPKCPPHIQGEWRKIFYWLCRVLKPMNVLTDADGLMLEGWSAQILTFRKAMQQYNEGNGALYIKSPKTGFPVPAPYIIARDVSWRIIESISGKFGMDPHARTQLRVALSDDKVDPFDAHFAKRPPRRPG